MGGATPIHLPKSPLVTTSASSKNSSSKKAARTGSAASVFRGRPEAQEPPRRSAADVDDDDEDEDSPQKILLSLRTPSTSFEEAGHKKKSSPSNSLSPGDVPTRSPEQLFEVRADGVCGCCGV